MARLLSGRVKKTPQSGLTSDRYEFLGLDQAEPDLGDPLIGPSSTGANPYPPGTQYVLINVGGNTGERYWIPSESLVPPGLTPGSFTVFNNNVQVGAANSFNVFNFVGTGVTVDFVGQDFADQTGVATVRIAITDVLGIGNDYEVAYNNPITGKEAGATGFVYRNGKVGIGSTIPVQTLDVNGTVGFTTLNILDLSIGTGATVLKTYNGNIGIGTQTPKYAFEFSNAVGISSLIYDGKGSPGSDNEILISKGQGKPPEWTPLATAVPAEKSNSIKTKESDEDRLFYIGFSSNTDSYSQLFVDSNGLYYNPSSVELGIGTQPQYALDVNGTIRADELLVNVISSFPGILSTTSTGTAVLDTFNSGQFRSARYTVQTTTTGRLSNYSISGLSSGSQYSLGIYSNINLIPSLSGEQATANITVSPRISTQISSTILTGGIFTTTGSIAGIPTGTLVAFGTTISPNPYEESKITELQITNSGAGFTSVPNIVFDSPTIIGNPVLGVGVGSTALVTDVSMKVTNAILNSVSPSTTVPTVVFSSPVGGGVTAQGTVGFGISSFTITGVGSAYTTPPTISYDQTPTSTPVVSVGLGISDANVQITPGSGYDGTTTFTITPVGGIGTDATIILGSLNGSGGIADIDITNIGTGYTTPPTVIVNGTGVGAAVTITELVLANLDIVSTGSGFTTSKPTVTLSGGGGTGASADVNEVIATNVNITNPGYGYTGPVTAAFNVIGVGASVALGINSLSITSGLGYTSIPDVVIDSPTLSPFTESVLTPVLGYGPEFDLMPGPGYGGTAYYYIDPIDNNTFRITKDFAGTDYVTLGYDVTSNPNVYIDGIVTNVDIQKQGSGFQIGEVVSVNNNNLYSPFSEVVGTGFSFTVSNLVESFQTSDILLLQSVGSATTNVSIVEYAGISDTENLMEYSADLSGIDVRLNVTPNYANNTIVYNRFPTRI
jgi:hypothetical protein